MPAADISQLDRPNAATEVIVENGRQPVRLRIYPAAANEAKPRAEPRAGLVWVHGGGFAYGDLDMPEAHRTAELFAARNITVISVDYRLCQGGTAFPAPSDDVLAAWKWTTRHAGHLGIDQDRLILGGASAGGNLAAGAVLRLLESSVEELPRGLFLAYPTLHAIQPPTPDDIKELLARLENPSVFSAPNVLDMYLNYLGGPIADAPAAAIPGIARIDQLRGFPPTIMINSEADELRVSGEAFAAVLQAAGTRVDTFTEQGTEHGHLNHPGEVSAVRSVERVKEWLTQLTGTSHEAPVSSHPTPPSASNTSLT